MKYEELISKFCPAIKQRCIGGGGDSGSCAAYHGNAEAGRCILYGQEVGGPAPIVGDPAGADPAPAAE